MSTKIIISTAENPLTAALPETYGLTPAERAVERFAISGNAIVTGGAGDLALASGQALLEHGLQGLCIFDIAPRLETSKGAIQALVQDFPLATIVTKAVDVRYEKSVKDAVDATVDALGGVDILLCFAGIARTYPAMEMTPEQWHEVLDINATGCFLTSKHVANKMAQRRRGGSIVLVASIAASRSIIHFHQSAYGVSKAAVLHLKSNLSAEWAQYGIRVNSVSPGFMDTSMTQNLPTSAIQAWCERTPQGRMGKPEELTGPIVMLCSRAGRYITGADIIVDGGALVF